MIFMRDFISKLMYDILRDRSSKKYSITKTIALLSFMLLVVVIIFATYIMIQKKEIDYFLIGELMFFILTLLGFKNLRPAPDYNNKRNKVEE